MKPHICLWQLIARMSDLEGSRGATPKWHRHLRNCPPCAADYAEQQSVAARLSAAAAHLQLPPVDAARLTRVAIKPRDAPRRGVWVPQRRLTWKIGWAAAALLITLVAILPQRERQELKPPAAEIVVVASVDELVQSLLLWTGGMLRGAMLEAELRLLIRDARIFSSTMAEEISAPFHGVAPL